jgi:hypothetical protein
VRVVGQVAPGPVSFTIEPYVSGGFVLDIGFEQGGRMRETARAGRWPTPEKAQAIAQRIASELLNGATVAWDLDAPPPQ